MTTTLFGLALVLAAILAGARAAKRELNRFPPISNAAFLALPPGH